MQRKLASQLALVVGIVAACGPAAASPIAPATISATAPSAAPPPSAAPVVPSITPEVAIAVEKPGWIAFDGTSIVIFSTTGAISRIDPETNDPSAPAMVDPDWNDGGFAMNDNAMWVSDFDANLVYQVDPTSLAVVKIIPVPNNPSGAGASADGVWVANHRGGSVTRIDPKTNVIVATVAVSNIGSSGPHSIGFGLGSVWVSAGNSGTVVRIDPATNKVEATIPIPPSASACGSFAIHDDAVWTTSCWDSPVLVRIDPRSNAVAATIDLDGYGNDSVFIDGELWLMVASLTEGGPGRFVHIDSDSNTIDRTLSLGAGFSDGSMLVAAGSVWVTDWGNNQVLRLPLAAFAT